MNIDLYTIPASEDAPGEWEQRCRGWMTDQEKARADQIRHASAQNQHVVGRGISRRLVSQTLGIPTDSLRLCTNENGKPAVAPLAQDLEQSPNDLTAGSTDHADEHEERSAGCCDVAFNVSHTAGLVLLGIYPRALPAGNLPHLGVDIERVGRRTDPRMANRFFAAEEADWVFEHTEGPQRMHAFLRVWTLKESLIKAIGRGLAIPLDQFAFRDIDQPYPPPVGRYENAIVRNHPIAGCRRSPRGFATKAAMLDFAKTPTRIGWR
ncbi:MAG: 4'-phosphopantetheinyl transferase superfamily protein [Planctomycetota bacterium]